MTTFLLIRHAHTEAVGQYLAGRLPGVALSPAGRNQLDGLTRLLADQPIDRICSSPLERTRETAEALGRARGLPVEIANELNEVDFGDWTGRTFAELGPDLLWQAYNVFRSGTRIPGGEVMHEVQDRTVGFLQKLREAHPDHTFALVTHGDVIRAALAYYLGLPMDLFPRLDVDPASVSAVQFESAAGRFGGRGSTINWYYAGPRVLYINRV